MASQQWERSKRGANASTQQFFLLLSHLPSIYILKSWCFLPISKQKDVDLDFDLSSEFFVNFPPLSQSNVDHCYIYLLTRHPLFDIIGSFIGLIKKLKNRIPRVFWDMAHG
jgi:hypothetical protein